MIHYHGLPITPGSSALCAVQAGHAFVSHKYSDQLPIAQEICQSYAIDNGAFSAWKAGRPVLDWTEFAEWAATVSKHPGCDFVVIPDIIDGTWQQNDKLLEWWPLAKERSAPVWHMHDPLERLADLASQGWNRVCLGSSAQYATVGNALWWERMGEAMGVLCDENGFPVCKLHGLRMLDPKVFTQLPLHSADSTNIARNIGIDKAWKGTYLPPNKDIRAAVMRSRIESHNSASSWRKP